MSTQHDDAERALARFGAAVAQRWWLDCGRGRDGFFYRDKGGRHLDTECLDSMATRLGVMLPDIHYTPAPGIAEAVARLTGGAA